MSEVFDDSRRLTGINLYFPATGAALETVGIAVDASLVLRWQANLAVARQALGWPAEAVVARLHAAGASLAMAAPPDQLYAATEVNEWALEAALGERLPPAARRYAPGHAAAWDPDQALPTLRAAAAAEACPHLAALLRQAAARGLPALLDDDALTLGEGTGGRTWSRPALPAVDEVDWDALAAIPVALVTGSNGKTTTTRLVAAMTAAHGWITGASSTDGVVVAGETIESGDYSGPGGARAVLRDRRVQAAVLETARGGLLRRGLAVAGVQAAIVTNISADHFGEYGIHDLDDLADTKLVVAGALAAGGVLVLNAEDPLLRARAPAGTRRLAWFALDADHPLLAAQRARHLPACGVRAGRLLLSLAGADHDLGAVDAMPLSVQGHARYNVANITGAALLAALLGVPPATIAAVLARFGGTNTDNAGRLMRWSFGPTQAWLDYAHNPAGLEGLIAVAQAARGPDGRFALVLGQAGNREDADIRALASTAARFAPDLVVLKDIESYLRGRASGQIAAILRDQLLHDGLADGAIHTCLDEVEAARVVLRWARPGDALVLPIHDAAARTAVIALLDRLATEGWRPGRPLPGEAAA